MPDRIDPNDFDSVVWLQAALARLLPVPRPMMVGQLEFMTWKAIQSYQELHGLEPTPVVQLARPLPGAAGRALPARRAVPLQADEAKVLAALLQHIQQQLRAKKIPGA